MKDHALRVSADNLRTWTASILGQNGIPPADAECVADVLVAADLRGVDTHGVFLSLRNYVDRINRGLIKREPTIRRIRESTATALLDGDMGFGHLAACEAIHLAMAKARDCGVGIVSVANSTHLGMVGYYPLIAAAEDMIGVAVSNTAPIAVPTFGVKPMLGSNPISIAAPAHKYAPFLLDMATSVVAGGKIQTALLDGLSLPEGWLVDSQGKSQEDPAQFLKDGFLLPLGGDHLRGSHKGYGLAVAVDILCGILSGSGYGATMARGQNHHLLVALNIAAFQPLDSFKLMMDNMIEALRACPKEPGQDRIYIAGEIEYESALERSSAGIPVPEWAVSWMEEAGRSIQKPVPW